MRTKEKLTESLAGFFAGRAEILEAYLFGSYARDAAQTHSDIDIAVFVDHDLCEAGTFGYDASLTTDLMQKLATNDIDLILLNQAPPVLYHRVLRDGVRVFSRDLRATTVREGQALSRYCDYVPQLAKIAAAVAYRNAQGKFGR